MPALSAVTWISLALVVLALIAVHVAIGKQLLQLAEGARPESDAVRSAARSARAGRSLRCPRCGGGGILRTWLKIRTDVRRAVWRSSAVRIRLLDRRIRVQPRVGEGIAIGVPIIWMIAPSPTPWTLIEVVGRVLAVALPFVFFPFSRTLWLAWDLSFRPRAGD